LAAAPASHCSALALTDTNALYGAIVVPGDTLAQIAKRFNVTLDALARANNIVNTDLVFWGMTFVIP